MKFTLVRWYTTGLDILVNYNYFDAYEYIKKQDRDKLGSFIDWLNSHPSIGDEFRFNNNLYALIWLG